MAICMEIGWRSGGGQARSFNDQVEGRESDDTEMYNMEYGWICNQDRRNDGWQALHMNSGR